MTSDQIEELNRVFQVEGVRFVKSSSGPVVQVRNRACEAAISLHGAHVLSYVPAKGEEVIFVSKKAIFQQGMPVRGGIPICWPWFGDHPDRDDAFSHGFARRQMWELKSISGNENATELTFSLSGGPDKFPFWPHSFETRFVVVAGNTLELTLETRNTGSEPFTVSEALHTYFRVGDVHKVRIAGLDGCAYQDDAAGKVQRVQTGDITFSGELDRVYLDTDSACVIHDPSVGRRITVQKAGSLSTVVWNPWSELAAGMKDMDDDEYIRMVCLETTNALADSRTVDPGQTHKLLQRIKATPLRD